nr:hypothetical protein [Tanacetum cinerariifolium]
TLTSLQKTDSSKQSSSVSSDFACKFLIMENVSPAVDEVTSMMNVKSHHEESNDLLSTRIGYATRTALKSCTKDFEKKVQEERKLYIDRDHDVKDKDEDSSAGSDRGLKKQKTGKDVEPPKGTKAKESQVHLKAPRGDAEDQPNVKTTLMDEWFKKLNKPPTPDRPWNDGKSIDSIPSQKWISNITKARQPPHTFDELMSTPIDFSAYVMHNLKIDNQTQEILKNPEGHEYPFDLSKPLSLIEAQGRQVVPADYFFNNDLEYLKDQTLHKFKEGDFPRLNQPDIKDLLLFLVQKKLSNLEQDVIFDLDVA